jgi:hypothetical protein
VCHNFYTFTASTVHCIRSHPLVHQHRSTRTVLLHALLIKGTPHSCNIFHQRSIQGLALACNARTLGHMKSIRKSLPPKQSPDIATKQAAQEAFSGPHITYLSQMQHGNRCSEQSEEHYAPAESSVPWRDRHLLDRQASTSATVSYHNSVLTTRTKPPCCLL